MLWPNLKRARRFAAPVRGWFFIQLAAPGIAIIALLLLILIGLAIELLVDKQVSALDGDATRWLSQGLILVIYESLGPMTAQAWLGALILVGIALSFMAAALVWIGRRSAEDAALDVVDKLRKAILAQAFRLGSGSVGSRRDRSEALIGEKCDQVGHALAAWWRTLPRSAMLLIALFAVALLTSASLTLALLSLIALGVMLRRWSSGRAMAARMHWEHESTKLQRSVVEHLRQVPLATGYSLDGAPGGDGQRQLVHLHRATFRARTSNAWISAAMIAFVGVAAGLATFLAGHGVLRSPPGFSVAGMVVLAGCFVCAVSPVLRLIRLPEQLNLAETSASEIFLYLDRQPGVGQIEQAQPVRALAKDFALEKVRLADTYGHTLLDDLSITVAARQRVAILATDPQVPRALAGMLVRFYDPAAGSVMYDGCDLRQMKLSSLRQQVVLVTGDGGIFSGTVTDNIRCGNEDYSQLEVIDAAKLVRAYSFIKQLPQGFATPIGDEGNSVSPPQAFRIALARAALREPSVIVVEEPDYWLDETTSSQLDDALRHLSRDKTLITLARRVDTLRQADRVFLIHEGKLEAAGTHMELLQQSALYRHINYMRYNDYGTAIR